jgi:hypothetical protein
MAEEYYYRVFNLVICSQIPSPLLLACDKQSADVQIRLGSVCEGNAAIEGRKDELIVRIAGGARYRIIEGREIIIDLVPNHDPNVVQLYLHGTILAALMQQRGYPVLHANTVSNGSNVVSIAGASGAGKSTLTARLLQKGYKVLSDDVTVLDVTSTESILALPSYPHIKLWRDSLDALQISLETLAQIRPEHQKYYFPCHESFEKNALPLNAIYIIDRMLQSHAPAPLKGAQAFARLQENSYRTRNLAFMGLVGQQFRLLSILSSKIPVFMIHPNAFSTEEFKPHSDGALESECKK